MPSSSACAWACGDARLEAGQAGEAAAAAPREGFRRAAHHERNPGFGLIADAAEPCGHDADDRVREAVEFQGTPEDAGVPTETALPEAGTEYHHGVAHRHFVLFGAEGASQCGTYAQQFEVGLGDVLARDALGLRHAGKGHGAVVEGGHRFKGAALRAPIREVGIGRAAALDLGALHGAPQFHQAARLGIRQRAQDHGVDHTENGGVGADAEGQREGGDHRKAGALA